MSQSFDNGPLGERESNNPDPRDGQHKPNLQPERAQSGQSPSPLEQSRLPLPDYVALIKEASAKPGLIDPALFAELEKTTSPHAIKFLKDFAFQPMTSGEQFGGGFINRTILAPFKFLKNMFDVESKSLSSSVLSFTVLMTTCAATAYFTSGLIKMAWMAQSMYVLKTGLALLAVAFLTSSAFCAGHFARLFAGDVLAKMVDKLAWPFTNLETDYLSAIENRKNATKSVVLNQDSPNPVQHLYRVALHLGGEHLVEIAKNMPKSIRGYETRTIDWFINSSDQNLILLGIALAQGLNDARLNIAILDLLSDKKSSMAVKVAAREVLHDTFKGSSKQHS